MTDLCYLTSHLYGTSLLIARPKLEAIGKQSGCPFVSSSFLSGIQRRRIAFAYQYWYIYGYEHAYS